MRDRLLILLILILAACASPPAAPAARTPITAVSSTAAVPTAAMPEKTKALPADTPMDTAPSPYPDLGPAPEIAGDIWLNADAPLRLADLRGKVVLIDMWTFG